MYFLELSKYFQRLESTASRNEMVVILAELFKEASADEIGKITYLLQGRVAPLFEPIEFGMAEKYVIKALALAYNIPLEKITDEFKKTGDLGKVAEKDAIASLQHDTVTEVFEKLEEITRASGDGSVEKKVEILANLLKESDPLSAKYIARTPVDKLRLGFSDMTILEALSWMICGSKKLKDELEKKYNVRPDLGFIAKQAKIHDSRFIIQPVVGTPILVMRAERLTTVAEIMDKGEGTMAVEPKLDGLRTQLHFGKEVRLFSRGLENVTTMYPDLVAAAKKELTDEIILDGEAIGFDPKTGKYLPFQETVQRKRKYDVDLFSKNVPLRLVVFDILFLNGKNLINEPYLERRKLVEKYCRGPIIVAAEMKVVDKPDELEKFFQDEVKKGLEGIMAKKLDGVYQAGARGFNWIKLKGSYDAKLADSVDAVVMGIDYGQGKRNKFGVGAFLIGVYDQKTDSFKTVSKVGTGLTDAEWKQLAVSSKRLATKEKPANYDVNKIMNCDVWLTPKIVGEFRADELTKSPMHTAGYALRFPRLLKWREKKPEDTTTLKEIIEMVHLKIDLPAGRQE